MKLKFESNLPYQQEAIQVVLDLFEGLPKQTEFETNLIPQAGTLGLDELGVGHRLELPDEVLLKNLALVQESSNIPKSPQLFEPNDVYPFPNFSVEMETGTGKTYVYLRTLFELNQQYGFKKFIIVVPSVAIREGVISSLDMMREHFRGLYGNIPFDHFVYNSTELSKVRQFAVSNEIQIMIINIQAFQKEAGNVIHQEQDRMSGRKPIEYIQSTRPIVIIDEPQSVDTTEKSQKAIKTLSPLFCLRYSATHKNHYHLLYQLDPIKAYDLKLVKQIEVASIQSETDFNQVFLRLDKIEYAKGAQTPHAKVTLHEDTPHGPKEKSIKVKHGTDLNQQTTRAGYDGYIVSNICAEVGLEHIAFTNGHELQLKQEIGGMGKEILKAQIKQTVEEHFKKEKRFQNKGIKVLSLFFVDRVAHYRTYDNDGNPQKGDFAQWFEEAFTELSQKTQYQGLIPFDAEHVHNGYFSADSKKGQTIFKDTNGSSKADDDTFNLIMRDKERLLSHDEPLRFIFSHSALREGWDNPNVFQICSLREMATDRERRQTLGRGLRLPVNQNGDRIYDSAINKLTVIASESFEEYVKGLQQDIEKDMGEGFKFGRIKTIAFAQLGDQAISGSPSIGQEKSEQIWKELVTHGYLDAKGDITNKFVPDQPGFQLALPENIAPIALQAAIIDEMKRYIFNNRVVNARDRRLLKYNKRIELNQDFQILWQKISPKTRYLVEFQTTILIQRAVDKIKQMEPIRPVQILINKTEVGIQQAGIEAGRTLDTKTEAIAMHQALPDILSYLQRETELTRSTLFEILKQSQRLKEFALNSQAFMTETAKLIQRALNELIVDGIKYEPIHGQYYEMRLFEEKEIEEYLSGLYQVQSKDERTPYDYVPYEFGIEKGIVEKLDSHENVKFYCKLPRWFAIPTPLGTYNPDWAIVTEQDEKLYLVRETKSTHDRDKRREIENKKIDCGRAHFKALGVNFNVATSINEVIS